MQGFISSRTTYYNYKIQIILNLCWPFQYNIGLKQMIQMFLLINYLPKNKIESTNVSQTLGYNIGGNFNQPHHSVVMDPLTTQNRLAIHNKIMLVKWNNKTQKCFMGCQSEFICHCIRSKVSI